MIILLRLYLTPIHISAIGSVLVHISAMIPTRDILGLQLIIVMSLVVL